MRRLFPFLIFIASLLFSPRVEAHSPKHSNANLEVTRFAYNTRSQLTDLWDGLNQNTHWTYDEYGFGK